MILRTFFLTTILFFFVACEKSSNDNNTTKDKEITPPTEINTTTDSDDDGLADIYEKSLGLVVGKKDASQPSLDPLYSKQWHLKNTIIVGEDIHIEPVWKETLGNKNITVSIVDTGIDANHTDITVDLNKSYRYSDDVNNPSPDASQLYTNSSGHAHGTACAGIVAAKGWNSKGVRGVAPNVTLVGLNVFSNPTDATFASALLKEGVDISSNSWGGGGANTLYDDKTSLEAISSGVKSLRDSKGVVYVFASGNDSTNANFQSILTSGFVIAVSSVSQEGVFEDYSDYGANILISAPGGSRDTQTQPAIITTDIAGLKYGMDVYKEHWMLDGNEEGDYTNTMNGTSASCPVVSGVVALMLSTNSDLTYRDVQYILAKTARQNDKDDASWKLNGVNIPVSDKYGFGVVDAFAVVQMAKTFTTLGSEQNITKAIEVKTLPASQNEMEYKVDIDENILVQNVHLVVKTDHNNNGKLRIVIESPSGTKSTLAYGDTVLYSKYNPWKFLSTQFLDEKSEGNWKVYVEDMGVDNKVGFLTLTLEIKGYKR